MKTVLTLPVVFLGFVMSQAGLAHDLGRGHIRGGIFVGGPVYWPWHYNRPYYYYPPYIYPPVVAVPAPPPIYYYPPVVAVPAPPPAPIEGSAISAHVPSQAYWYYCNDAQAYYPYVNECPGGWQQIVALPPPPPPK